MKFVAKSGNRATVTITGRGNRFAVDIAWLTNPSKEDIAEFDSAWRDANDGHVVTSVVAPDNESADRIAQQFLGRSDN